MNYRWNKKYLHWGITIFLVLILSSSFFLLVFYGNDIMKSLAKIITVLTPIIYGLCFAYLLIPVMNWMEQYVHIAVSHFFGKRKKPIKLQRLSRMISVLGTVGITLFCFTLVIVVLVPEIVRLTAMVTDLSKYVTSLNDWIDRTLKDKPQLADEFNKKSQEFSGFLQEYFRNTLLPQLNPLLQSLGTGVFGVMSALKDIILGFILSIYILFSKDLFIAQTKRLLYGMMSIKNANNMIAVTRKTHTIFSGFISGKLLDSLIVALICFVVMSLFQWPLALLISIVIGISNLIPFFGPFIGAIPSAFFLLLYDPKICLYFIIFILILQQVDGNFIGPRILGNSTGISGFWVLVSLLIGGGLFGVKGMLLAVPTFAVLYTLCREWLVKKLQNKGLPADTMEYRHVAKIEDNGRVVKLGSIKIANEALKNMKNISKE